MRWNGAIDARELLYIEIRVTLFKFEGGDVVAFELAEGSCPH